MCRRQAKRSPIARPQRSSAGSSARTCGLSMSLQRTRGRAVGEKAFRPPLSKACWRSAPISARAERPSRSPPPSRISPAGRRKPSPSSSRARVGRPRLTRQPRAGLANVPQQAAWSDSALSVREAVKQFLTSRQSNLERAIYTVVRRLLFVLLLGFLVLDATGLEALVRPEPCASLLDDQPDGTCPPTCAQCACGVQVVVPALAVTIMSAAVKQTFVDLYSRRVPPTLPAEIFHVPKVASSPV
jgi:hypothetical protein